MDYILKFSSLYKDCFCRLYCSKQLSVNQSILQLRNDNDIIAYVTCKEVYYSESANEITINGLYGYKNQLIHDSKVIVTVECSNPTSLIDVYVEPETMNDWELIQMHCEYIENNLLNQIRCVSLEMLIPVWVDEICIFMKIKRLTPSVPYGLLTVSTQVHIIPKSSTISSDLCKRQPPLQSDKLDTNEINNRTGKSSNSLLKSDCIKSNLWTRFVHLLDFLYSIIYRKPFTVWRQQDCLIKSLCERFHSDDCTQVGRVISLDKLLQDNAPRLSQITQEDLCHSSTALFLTNPHSCLADQSSIIVQVKHLDPPGHQTSSESVVSIFLQLRVSVTSKVTKDSLPVLAVSNQIIFRNHLNIGDRVLLVPQHCQPELCPNLKLSVEEKTQRLNCIYESAFKNFVKRTSSAESPILVYNNMPLFIPLDAENHAEVTVEINNSGKKSMFYLITELLLEGLPIHISTKTVQSASDKSENVNDKFIGFESTLNALVKYSEKFLCSKKPASILLLGSEASGKSTLGERLLHYLKDQAFLQAHTRYISCKSLIGKQVENLRRHMDSFLSQSVWHCPSAVFLDDLDVLAPKSPEVTTNPQEEFMQDLIAETIRSAILKVKRSCCPIIILASAKSVQHMHDRLGFGNGSALFEHCIEMEALNKSARSDLLKGLTIRQLKLINKSSTQTIGNSLSQRDFNHLGDATACFVVGDLERLVNQTLSFLISRQSANISTVLETNTDSSMDLDLNDFRIVMKSFQPLAFSDLQDNGFLEKFSLDDIGGLETAKTSLIETFVWPVKYPNLFAQSPIKLQHGALLYGPPGCGKTLTALALARESNMNLLMVKGPELLNKYIGASETAVRDLISRARKVAPALILFDEFESLAPRRGHDSTGVTDRVVNQLLTELDGVDSLGEVFIIATSNRPDLIDPALLRPGRIQMKIYCPLPDENARQKILNCMNNPKSAHKCLPLCSSVNIPELARNTENFASADLFGLLNRAGIEAMKRNGLFTDPTQIQPEKIFIKQDDVDLALQHVRPSLKPKELEQYLNIYRNFQSISSTKRFDGDTQQVTVLKATLN